MRVLRGGHRVYVEGDAAQDVSVREPCPRMHYLLQDWQICDSEAQEFPRADVVTLPVSPGSLILFDGLLPHGTPANRSSEPRRAVQFHYARPDADGCANARRVQLFDGTVRGVRC
jgi:phytanoyl-CoA hydroxylase